MRRQQTLRDAPGTMGQRLAFPVVLLGSLFVIALLLYAVDTTPLRTVLLAP